MYDGAMCELGFGVPMYGYLSPIGLQRSPNGSGCLLMSSFGTILVGWEEVELCEGVSASFVS